MRLPELFTLQMRQLLCEETDAFLESFAEKPYAGLRINKLKGGAETILHALGKSFTPVPWCAGGFYDDRENRLSKNPLYNAGLYYLQEPSAMCPGAVLNPQPRERVLDLCAAPGGKCSQMAAEMKGTGLLVANDASPSRCHSLLKNLSLMGVTNSLVTCETPERLSRVFRHYFHKVLVDAPCSGEGMFRKDPSSMKNWRSRADNPYPAIQREILRHAASLLAPKGRLVYATCTFNTQENEEIIRQFLADHKDFSIVPLDHAALGIDHGFAIDGDDRLLACGRIWPHKHKGEGHFLALLERDGSQAEQKPLYSADVKPIPAKELETFKAFCGATLTGSPEGNLILHEKSLFLQPVGAPDLSGLRVVSSGFYLGDFKSDGFQPSQAFAMGLTNRQAASVVSYPPDHPWIYRYLKGESPEAEAGVKNGWCLVCAGDYPLGWGKAQNGRLKNKMERSWLMQP